MMREKAEASKEPKDAEEPISNPSTKKEPSDFTRSALLIHNP